MRIACHDEAWDAMYKTLFVDSGASIGKAAA
jgi:hypothetical protein